MNWYVVIKIGPMDAYDLLDNILSFEINYYNSSYIEMVHTYQNLDYIRDNKEDNVVHT